MPICSYLVLTEPGATTAVADRLERMPRCDVVRAKNRDLLLLVTDTPGLREEETLRSRIEATEGIQALLLTFGEVVPGASNQGPSASVDR
ncbi:MAG: chaperone NapD [Gemmatimonadota bacterium]|nr:chaperone NapD [Gemmatimonadota bacterium]